jgi:hypothetical protein
MPTIGFSGVGLRVAIHNRNVLERFARALLGGIGLSMARSKSDVFGNTSPA